MSAFERLLAEAAAGQHMPSDRALTSLERRNARASAPTQG